jgi:lipopolysaccharide export system protein LptA
VKVQDRAVSEIVARGNVVLTEGTRRGAGEQATYDARTGSVTLTGKDASVSDPERGTVRGRRLVMEKARDRVTVESEAGSKVESRVKR